MPDIFNFSDEMQNYFNTLPEAVQETIVQTGAKVGSLDDLKQVAENLTKSATQ